MKDLDKIDRKLQENSNELDYILNQAKKKLGIDVNARGLNVMAENILMKNKKDSLTVYATKVATNMKRLSDAVVAAVRLKVEEFKKSDAVKYLENLRREIKKFIATEEVDEGQIQLLKCKLEEIDKKLKLFNKKLEAIQSL